MGSEWLKNMCGATLSDEQMQIIPHSTTELVLHVTTKTVQAFGLIGTFLVGPAAAAYNKETRNRNGFKEKMIRYGKGGLKLGLVTGPVLTYLSVRKDEEERIWDRCYRLRYNRGQVRADRASIVCAAAGAGIAVAMEESGVLGGLVGMTVGLLLAAMYNSISKE